MKVWLVLINHSEGSIVVSIHQTKEGARNRWDSERRELLNTAKRHVAANELPQMYSRMVEKLECTDPDGIDNYPHDTPKIEEHEVEL